MTEVINTKLPVDGEESQDLDEYELENIYKLNSDKVWYYYHTGWYDGSGQMIILKAGKYALYDMGHCSCYGPTDSLNRIEKWFDSLDELKNSCSKDYYKEDIEKLVNFIETK